MKEALGDEPINAVTKDGKNIYIEGSILFKLDKANAPELWESIGDNFVSKVIRPYSRSRIASAFGQYNLDEIGSERTKIEQTLKQELNALFHDKALIIENILFSNVSSVPVSATS
jgi:regulator of protease activity HflC (stomatin/prohibitin superfamily)